MEAVFNEDLDIIEEGKNDLDWLKIRLANGQFGYIAKKYSSEFIYDTLLVSLVEGKWKITAFYGDTRD